MNPMLLILVVPCMVAFLIALMWPRTAVLMLMLLTGLWPSYIVFQPVSGIPWLNPQRILTFIIFIAWFFHLSTIKNMRQRILAIVRDNKILFLFLTLYYLWSLISGIIVSPEKGRSLYAGIYQMIAYPFLMLLVISYFKSKNSLSMILMAFLVILLITTSFGVLEWFHQRNIFSDFITPASEYAEQSLAGKERESFYRITSTLSNPLSFAEFLIMMTPVVLYLIYHGRNIIVRQLSVLQLALIVTCVIMIKSRTGYVLLLFSFSAVFLYWYVQRINSLWKWLSALALICIAMLMVHTYLDRIADFIAGTSSRETSESSAARAYQLYQGIPAVLQSPVTGYGLLQGAKYVEPLKAIDNYYLTVALETGLTGLTLLILAQFSVLKLAWKDMHVFNPTFRFYATLSFVCLYINELTLSIVQNFAFYYIMVGMLLIYKYLYDHPKLESIKVPDVSRGVFTSLRPHRAEGMLIRIKKWEMISQIPRI